MMRQINERSERARTVVDVPPRVAPTSGASGVASNGPGASGSAGGD